MNNWGVVISLALLLGSFFYGAVLASRPSLGARRVGLALVSLSLSTVLWGIVDLAREGSVDLNPTGPAVELVGHWKCEFGALDLTVDGAFRMSGADPWQGHWSRDGWALSLTAPLRTEHWRIIKYSRRGVVLLRDWDDPSAPIPAGCQK